MDTIDISPEFEPSNKEQLRQQIDDLSKVYDHLEAMMGALSLIRLTLAGMVLPGLPGLSVVSTLRINSLTQGIYFHQSLMSLQAETGTELTDLQITLDVMEGLEPGGNDER